MAAFAKTIQEIAGAIVEPHRGKTFTHARMVELSNAIVEAVRFRSKLMQTFSPYEIRQIAEATGVDEKTVTHVLHSAGGSCLPSEDIEELWATIPDTKSRLLKNETGPNSERARIEAEIKMLLHASRDAQRNSGIDTTAARLSTKDPYYGEAFGIIRALHALGYGYLGAVNVKEPDRWNLTAWFYALKTAVLDEEHFGTTNECDWCLERYGRDAVREKAR